MLVSPQIHMLNPIPQCDGIRRWGLWEVISSGRQRLHKWDQWPYERELREFSSPFCHVRPPREASYLWTRRRSSLDTKSAGAFIAGLPIHHVKWKCSLLQSYLIRCDPMNCSPPDSSVHRILQARILEWVAILFSTGSSWSGDQTRVSHIAGRLFILSQPGNPFTFTPIHQKCGI